jgi:hypothetical protein
LSSSLVEKTLSPAHQKGLPSAHFGAPVTLMPAVMYYPWRNALFAGSNSTYCWRIPKFARGNLFHWRIMLCARDKITLRWRIFDAPGIIFLCASKNNYRSKKIKFNTEIIQQIYTDNTQNNSI